MTGAGYDSQPDPQYRAPDIDDDYARGTPSQAEGDRDIVEADLAEKGLGDQPGAMGERYASGTGGQGDIVTTPSQAEGDRDIIEADLAEKGLGDQPGAMGQ